MNYEALFYEEATNEITFFEVSLEVAMQFSLGSNVTMKSTEPTRIATMVGLVDDIK
jgi:hypothetical protein